MISGTFSFFGFDFFLYFFFSDQTRVWEVLVDRRVMFVVFFFFCFTSLGFILLLRKGKGVLVQASVFIAFMSIKISFKSEILKYLMYQNF